MDLTILRLTYLLLVVSCVASVVIPPFDYNADPVVVLNELQQLAISTLQNGSQLLSQGCSLTEAARRRDWEALSQAERKDYIQAVQCLIAKKPISDPTWASAARTRHDDFVALHTNVTLATHNTGNFFAWHRYHLWAYEKALRDECGYKGYQPYWNWFSHRDNLLESPLFDGSSTSMGGDGEFFRHNGSLVAGGSLWIPSGKGGGCVKSGPFKGMQVHIGPTMPDMDGFVPVGGGSNDYNPHCLRRDITSYVTKTWATTANLLNVTIGAASTTIRDFQLEIEGNSIPENIGFHLMGHSALAADGADLYTSPNDPVFYFHHTMVDRIWWLWQVLHPEEARKLSGTITMYNTPPSRNATLDDPLDMKELYPNAAISELLGTLDGTPLCYVYD
ncbi:hypothetical protein E0Z10_g7820 [Xylaria hypoxylon]|uniref:Tyrosinase copper-binding domain-containing protein n=1 Tax=Xylaria hypoxylon TaxID=37992 RepID=A0A4Z0YR50_9PEZI|nr:hypothetical protein E0Z10_g7820 [Xylaria hypoxylon]